MFPKYGSVNIFIGSSLLYFAENRLMIYEKALENVLFLLVHM